MRFIFSCLLSLSAHLALLLALTWLSDTPAPLPLNVPIKATLRHASVALSTLADTKTSAPKNPATRNPSTLPLPLTTKSAPKNLPGPSLRRAQAMLSKHLFYPPLAVTQGLEGEVVLLLTLDATGQIRPWQLPRARVMCCLMTRRSMPYAMSGPCPATRTRPCYLSLSAYSNHTGLSMSINSHSIPQVLFSCAAKAITP